MLSKEQLVYFPGDQSSSDNVGAYLTDAAGNLLTSTLVSGKQALDVNIANSITIAPESDSNPATQNITAQDVGSSTTTGANGQSIITGSPTAGSTASFTFSTQSSVRVQVSGTWTGALNSEVSLDGGTTWYPINVAQNTASTASSFSANFEGLTGVAAATQFRLRATAAWTGTATVQVIESVNNGFMYIGNDITVLQGTSPWNDNLTQVGGSAISLGQKAMAASFPVVIASDQSAVNVSAAQSGNWTVRIEDSAGNALNSTTGSLNVDVTNTVPVSQSGTWTVQQGTPPWSVAGNVADDAADSGNPVKVGSRAIVGAGPAAISTNNDRADLVSDARRRLYVNDGADIAAKAQNITVGASAAALPTALSGRRSLMVQNLGSKAIYIGQSSGVTSSNGLQVPASATLEMNIGEDVALFAISASGSQDVRLFELA